MSPADEIGGIHVQYSLFPLHTMSGENSVCNAFLRDECGNIYIQVTGNIEAVVS